MKVRWTQIASSCIACCIFYIISILCSDTAMSRPFPHSCEQRHQVEAWVDQIHAVISTSASFLLRLLTGVECGKGQLDKKVIIFVFLHLCFLSPISPQYSSARFWPLLISETRLNFLFWTQGEIGPGNRAHMKTPSNIFELNIYHHYQYQIKGWPNKTINKTYWERLFNLTAMLSYFTPRNITGTSLVTLSKHV